MDRRVPRATWVNLESLDRRDDRGIQASKAPLDSQDPRVFLVSKERRENLEPMGGRAPVAWLARMGLTDRRASWGASDLLAARETPGVGAPTAIQGMQAALGSQETKEPRGMLAAQDAEDPQETTGPRGARAIKATTEPQEALV